MLGKNAKILFSASIIVLIISIVIAVWGFPKIISRQLQKNVQIDSTSMTFDKWLVTPIPITFNVYMFNVTNAEEVNKGKKPILKELGPYVYREYRNKTILGYGDNDTVRYMLKKTFFFDHEASAPLSENDDVTIINYSYLAAILSVQQLIPSVAPTINKAFQQFFPNLTDPFYRVKVKDILFDGIFLNCVGDEPGLGLVCGKIRVEKNPNMRPIEDGKGYYFSMFNHLNNTDIGPFEMVRGTENIHELGHIVSFNNMTSMKMWHDPYCGMINGSDASIFPPIDPSNIPERLYIYESEICRSLYVNFAGPQALFNMSSYYYEIDESALASKIGNPNNKCFCRRNWSSNHDGCLLMGVLNVEPCKGAPAIISLPHFYLASEELLDYFQAGIKPNSEKHKSFVYLESKTGVVLKGMQRIQFNIEMRNMPNIPQLQNVTTGLFPLMWIEEGAELSEELQAELRRVQSLLGYAEVIRWLIVCAAVVLCAVSAVCLTRSGALGHWPRGNNSVSFILRPGNTSLDINKQ